MFEGAPSRGVGSESEEGEIDLANLAIEIPILEDKELGLKHTDWVRKMSEGALKHMGKAVDVGLVAGVFNVGANLAVYSSGAHHPELNLLTIQASAVSVFLLGLSRFLRTRNQAQAAASVSE